MSPFKNDLIWDPELPYAFAWSQGAGGPASVNKFSISVGVSIMVSFSVIVKLSIMIKVSIKVEHCV